MANAVIGDIGDVMEFSTGQNLTGWSKLEVFLTLPDRTTVTKNNTTHGVSDGGAPAAGIIYYAAQADVAAKDGEVYASVAFELGGGTERYSQPIPGVYVVRRRNQVT